MIVSLFQWLLCF